MYGPASPIIIAEVEAAINKTKNGKAIEPDDLPLEIWKMLGLEAAQFVADLFNIDEGKASPILLTIVTAPLGKGKGDVRVCFPIQRRCLSASWTPAFAT